VEDLKQEVTRTIDRVIRLFNSDNPASYGTWDVELENLQRRLTEAAPPRPELLGSVLAQRIFLAYEVERVDHVLELSECFRRQVPAGHPSSPLVLLQRAHALHHKGAHEEEKREVIDAARHSEAQGSELLTLLNDLSNRHPGSIPTDDQLTTKIIDAVHLLRARGYGSLPLPSGDTSLLESEIHQIVRDIRRVNRLKAEALLTSENR
jgi:hypothetical protein